MKKNSFEFWSEGQFYRDCNGNCWDSTLFNELKANALSEFLVKHHCFGNLDCEGCVNCQSCIGCVNCNSCKDCWNCKSCTGCSGIKGEIYKDFKAVQLKPLDKLFIKSVNEITYIAWNFNVWKMTSQDVRSLFMAAMKTPVVSDWTSICRLHHLNFTEMLPDGDMVWNPDKEVLTSLAMSNVTELFVVKGMKMGKIKFRNIMLSYAERVRDSASLQYRKVYSINDIMS